ncbi:VirB4 family type IV secretion system protein [Erwinia amylovora]|uniref:VirB4 n=1 Tax=Erwinia amylovora TaxID=552 RepID=Q6TFR5_ERWAM|nr:conjugative transfer protein [Erwinia amylovora]AAQ97955.1 VirB4 [Erwinia amylovora]UDJ88600.1 conjugal transfer protein [Erwinia amylovora]
MRDEYYRKTFSPENKKLPWLGYHVDPQICTLGTSHLLAVMRIKGVSHETRELSALNNEFKRQNRCFQAMGKQEGSDLMIQTYTFKRRVQLDTEYHLELPILQDFADAYTDPFREGEFRQVGYAMGLILKYRDLEDGIARMNDLLQICTVMLDKFGVSVLGMSEKNGQLYSETARFFSQIVNGTDQEVLVGESRLGDAMIDSETAFGAYDYVENRPYSGKRRFAATYDLMEFPAKSEPGMWDDVTEEQCDFCLTQTFHFAERNKIKTKINIQRVDLANSEGESKQTDKLEDDIQAITQGSLVMGNYHAGLVVFGDTPEQAVTKGARIQSLLSVKNAVFKRSTSSNINTWLTQFPAYSDVIYRAPRSTENLACGFSLHATPGGKATGNPIGDGTSMMPVSTVNGGLYFKNFTDSPEGKNSIGERLPGHTIYMAMTGAGKTTAEATDLLFISRFNTQFFCIDYNHAMENMLRALGTSYFSIQPNRFTDIQPFQWPDSDGLRQQLLDTVIMCVGEVDTDEEHLIKEGIGAVMSHYKPAERSLSLLHQYIPDRGGNALKQRLARWCRKVSGREGMGTYAWVLDSPTNKFNPENYRRLAFDCTPILKEDYVSTHGEVMVVLMNTFFYMKDVMKAREPHTLLVNQVSEIWACLMFDKTEKKLREILSAGRMRGEILLGDTQNPEQMLKTPAGPSFVQQVVTSIWLANENANRKSYAEFGVTGKQFDKVRELTKTSFEMMIKQGREGVMVKFGLSEQCRYFLPLLSADVTNLAVAAQIRNHLGTEDPAEWVRPFLDEMVAVRARQQAGSGEYAKWYPLFEEMMKNYGRKIYPLVLQKETENEA